VPQKCHFYLVSDFLFVVLNFLYYFYGFFSLQIAFKSNKTALRSNYIKAKQSISVFLNGTPKGARGKQAQKKSFRLRLNLQPLPVPPIVHTFLLKAHFL
jgi:hypothetical protein